MYVGSVGCSDRRNLQVEKLNILSKSQYNVDLILVVYCISAGQTSLLQVQWGFATSRPAAQRPPAHGQRRPSGPAARCPGPDFPQFFCPAVNPRACTDLHRVSAWKMDDGEFKFVYHLII